MYKLVKIFNMCKYILIIITLQRNCIFVYSNLFIVYRQMRVYARK